MKAVWIFFSFFIVAFGQPASIPYLGIVSSICGFALFWKGMADSRFRFWLPTLWFASVQGIQLFWMASTHYMGAMILLVYAGLIFAMGLQFGLLSYFFVSPQKFRFLDGLGIAGAWTLLEGSRLYLLTGFPFNPVGISLTDSVAIQWASIGGVYWLSFWVIWVNVLCYNAIVSRNKKCLLRFATAAIVPYLFGWIHPIAIEKWMAPAKELNVGLVQTALLPEQRSYTRLHPDQYVHPIIQWKKVWDFLSLDSKLDLIVLPEAAFPYGASRRFLSFARVKRAWIERFGEKAINEMAPLEAPYASVELENGKSVWKVNHLFMAQSLANFLKTELILGLDDEDANGKYNAAFHIRPHQTPERYEKRILVPVSEYLPLENVDFLSAFYAKEYEIFDSMKPGKTAKIFQAAVPIGPSICYEEVFGHAMRQLRLNGAELFVNVTNDVWYPRTRLPQQHFHHGRVRAAENGVFLLRACNTGVTGGADCFGKPLPSLPVSESEAGMLKLSIPVRSYPTLYMFWGDWAVIALSIFCLLPQFKKIRYCPEMAS